MREPADGWLQRDGIGLHFLEWKAESGLGQSPPILLIHGLSSNAHYWDRLAEFLPQRRLVALDQRGHGLTGRAPGIPPLPDGFAMDELLGDALHVVDSLDLGRPLVAGHSWGATVSLELAARHGDKVSALVFIDGPVQSAANLFSWEQAQSFMQPPLPRYSSFAQAIDDGRRDFDGAWADDLEPFVMSKLMQEGRSFVLTLTAPVRLELLRGLYDSPVDQLWADLDVPAAALLASGGPGGLAGWKESGAKLLRERAPEVRVQWFDTPHDIPLFAPEAVAAEIEKSAAGAARLTDSEPAAAQDLQN